MTQYLSSKVIGALTHLTSVAVRNAGRKRNWRRVRRARGEILWAREDAEAFFGYRFDDEQVRERVEQFSQIAELVE